MKILFTCGGTAGHINPAVALARLFQERSGAEVLFVGAKGGMEERLVPKEGESNGQAGAKTARRPKIR